MKNLVLISLKLPKELLERSKEIAEQNTTTVSALIRQLLVEYLNKASK